MLSSHKTATDSDSLEEHDPTESYEIEFEYEEPETEEAKKALADFFNSKFTFKFSNKVSPTFSHDNNLPMVFEPISSSNEETIKETAAREKSLTPSAPKSPVMRTVEKSNPARFFPAAFSEAYKAFLADTSTTSVTTSTVSRRTWKMGCGDD